MAAAFNMGVVGWSPLGCGLLTGKYRKGETGRAQGLGVVIHSESDARKTATVDAVFTIAKKPDCPPDRWRSPGFSPKAQSRSSARERRNSLLIIFLHSTLFCRQITFGNWIVRAPSRWDFPTIWWQPQPKLYRA